MQSLWMLVAAFVFSIMGVCVKLASEHASTSEIVIARGAHPVVKLVPIPEQRPERRLGGAAGAILFMADDFDAPLEDFQEYME